MWMLGCKEENDTHSRFWLSTSRIEGLETFPFL